VGNNIDMKDQVVGATHVLQSYLSFVLHFNSIWRILPYLSTFMGVHRVHPNRTFNGLWTHV